MHSTSTAMTAASTPPGKVLGEQCSRLGAMPTLLMPAVGTCSPLYSDRVMESPLPDSIVALLVQVAEGKDPVSVFNILIDYFYLKMKISFTLTGAVIKFNRVCDCKSRIMGSLCPKTYTSATVSGFWLLCSFFKI